MIDLGMETFIEQSMLRVQEEPELDIALPQVLVQPDLLALQRGRLANPEALIAQIYRRHSSDPEAALGADYQELVTEFQPLFAWTIACWDYLLSTEGCRFLPRRGEVKAGVRGDYRAVTDKDYSRIVHIMFRRCVFDFAQQPEAPSVGPWLRQRLWPMVLDAYRQLENPPDKRQRTLSPYSYLRCVPYQFLNDFHQVLVDATVARLPETERRAIETYFFNFFTEPASAESLGWPLDTLQASLRQGLVRLLVNDRLVYCLLRQIERY